MPNEGENSHYAKLISRVKSVQGVSAISEDHLRPNQSLTCMYYHVGITDHLSYLQQQPDQCSQACKHWLSFVVCIHPTKIQSSGHVLFIQHEHSPASVTEAAVSILISSFPHS